MSDDPFVAHRGLLFTVAYEMLGSAADAEDVVQETWLRWAARTEQRDQDEVHDPRAYLVRTVTRQALNRLRTLARRREEYVGEWLPEPLLTTPDVAADVELAESVSLAMLTVLETLTPTERAVFVLREVFDVPYEEIAAAVDKSPAAVRQIGHRARSHVAARRPRVAVDRREQRAVLERFLVALQGGDVQALMDVLAPDVVLIADGGGFAQAARVPIRGAMRIATFLRHFPRYAADTQLRTIWINAAPALRMDGPDPVGTSTISMVVEDGRITRLYAVRNPHKLGRIAEATDLTRRPAPERA
ncbi:RNA polymerase sigma-70 factor [Nocardioides sp. BP30]|uniref:RNA polymerase sigma-70 factor n=1 Tax=Nocardioides sp. BP30 TaxID=3036374 RepID=UPI0024696FE7|nr:RNA polymerase sigma-70 factor [Nocardioides sp. BP30]WGL53399.1 RNA polymerase sigma-70 factor [Nocardioides sp. BP30]